MLLLDDTKFQKEDFITKDGRFYFSMLDLLRKKDYFLHETTILSNLKPEIIERFEDMGGWETIQHQIDIINTQNFDIYVDIMYRENILLHMHYDGFNLLKTIDINGKQITPIALFRKCSAEEVQQHWYGSKT